MLGAIAGLVGTGLFYGPFLIISASNVNSVFDFGAAVVATVASLMVLVGSVVALVQLLRYSARTEAKPWEQNVLRAAGAVVVVIVAISAIATLASRDTVAEEERVGATEVLIKTTEFKTTKLDAKAGETLRLVLKNDDLYIHTFTIDDLAIDATVGPRGERALSITPAKAGEYEYTCSIPGHESMSGTLTVS